MTVNLHFEDSYTSIFKTIADSFNAKKEEFTNSILMTLIVTMKNKNKELRDTLFEIEENPRLLLSINLEEFFDTMLILEDNFKPLLKLAKKHKDKSSIFMEFYKTIDELYGTAVYVNLEIGFLESQLNHSLEIQNAS